MAFAPSAPATVNKFQKIKTPKPVSQKPSRIAWRPRASCERLTPVDSSIVTCAAINLLYPRTLRIGAISTPYKPFRIPNNEAVVMPLIAPPPAPITPITAN